MHLPIRGQALTLLLESSGMRIGEALQLQPEDLDLTVNPAKIQLRGSYTKTGDPRITFMSEEARETLLAWLKVKEDYIKGAVKKSHFYLKNPDDTRIFPFSSPTFYLGWNRALHKAGLHKRDPSTQRATLHPHVLRKFFRAKLGLVIPVDVVEALMGHGEYLTEVYRKYPDPAKTLREEYVKGVHALLVFGSSEQSGELKKLEDRNTQLQLLVNGLSAENLQLKNRMTNIELAFSKLEKSLPDKLKNT